VTESGHMHPVFSQPLFVQWAEQQLQCICGLKRLFCAFDKYQSETCCLKDLQYVLLTMFGKGIFSGQERTTLERAFETKEQQDVLSKVSSTSKRFGCGPVARHNFLMVHFLKVH
jgi:hypothetical protein